MRRLLLLLGLLSLSASAAEPTPAALRKAFEHNRQSVVKVTGPRQSGPGVVVGASGHVLTSVDYVSLREATVEVDGVPHTADVLMADAYQGIALVQVRGGQPLRSTPVKLDAEVRPGQSLVGVRLTARGPAPQVVKVRRLSRDGAWFQLDRTLQRGAPVFDAKGRLLGVAVSNRRVVPVDRVKQALTASAG